MSLELHKWQCLVSPGLDHRRDEEALEALTALHAALWNRGQHGRSVRKWRAGLADGAWLEAELEPHSQRQAVAWDTNFLRRVLLTYTRLGRDYDRRLQV